jgi:hypothetical protein
MKIVDHLWVKVGCTLKYHNADHFILEILAKDNDGMVFKHEVKICGKKKRKREVEVQRCYHHRKKRSDIMMKEDIEEIVERKLREMMPQMYREKNHGKSPILGDSHYKEMDVSQNQVLLNSPQENNFHLKSIMLDHVTVLEASSMTSTAVVSGTGLEGDDLIIQFILIDEGEIHYSNAVLIENKDMERSVHRMIYIPPLSSITKHVTTPLGKEVQVHVYAWSNGYWAPEVLPFTYIQGSYKNNFT